MVAEKIMAHGPRTKKRRIYGVVVGAAGCVVVLLLLAAPFYEADHLEWSPDLFARRYVTRWHIPFVGVAVRLHTGSVHRSEVEEYLHQNGLVPPLSAGKEIRWLDPDHFYPSLSWLRGRTDERKLVWIEWSRRHPHHARLLWPALVTLAREQQRGRCWILLLYARDPGSLEDFGAMVERLLNMTQKELDRALTERRLDEVLGIPGTRTDPRSLPDRVKTDD
ncbi:MAG: hypothetical protein ACYTFI_16775 [Planctomycetota bacterium]|jgi:hypothetical protein